MSMIRFFIAAGSVLSLTQSAIAEPSLVRLHAAEEHLRHKEYRSAIGLVQPMLDEFALDTVEEIILGHRILGVSQCELGDMAKAEHHYRALLTFSPTESISEFVVTQPCRDLFHVLKEVRPKTMTRLPQTVAQTSSQPIANRQDAPLEAKKQKTDNELTPTAAISDESSALSNESWKRWVPFGVGQFENGQRKKGTVFLVTQITASVLGITSFALFKAKESENGTFTDTSEASVYRALFWSSLGAGGLSAIWGITDARIVYRKQQYEVQVTMSPTGIFWHYAF